MLQVHAVSVCVCVAGVRVVLYEVVVGASGGCECVRVRVGGVSGVRVNV